MGNFDGLRGLTVTYNALKHPKTVASGTTSTLTYIYDAGGNKLSVSQDGTVKNYYCGDFVYTSGLSVDYILTPNGQMTRSALTGAYTAQYNITDHLGNVRSVVNSSGTVLQSTDYYPFGLAFSDANVTNNRYLYNGKELENYTIGSSYLGTLDYGARHYDARIGRWTVPDPMAEKYYGLSAYNYCANNPIMLVDQNGNNPIYDIYGNLLGTDDCGLKGEPIIMNPDTFIQGMSNTDALEYNLGMESLIDEKSAARFISSFISLRSRPDWDGELTLSEANDWYRSGQGQPLFVDINKMSLGTFFNERTEGTIVLRNLLFYSESINDALVFGNVTLKYESKNQVSFSIPDIYNFDIKPINSFSSIPRNISTIIGRMVAGPGKSYTINVYGSKQVRTSL